MINDHNYVHHADSDDDVLHPENIVQPAGLRRTPRRSRRLNVENTDHDYLAVDAELNRNIVPIFQANGDTDAENDEYAQNEQQPAIPELLAPQHNDEQAISNEGPSANAEAASTSAAAENLVVNLSSPSPPKKRKRQGTPKSVMPTVKAANASDDVEDDEDGLTCPICLDTWEMSGDHRLVALRCGHLFGESCIRRWLIESARQTGVKACPQCKTRATYKDIRFLYAKRLRAIDRSEEHRLREQLDSEVFRSNGLRTELASLKMSLSLVTKKAQTLESENERMKELVRNGDIGSLSLSPLLTDDFNKRLARYKLFMAHNVDIAREPGCRVMLYSNVKSVLAVSQKSTQGLFPGFGLSFVDTKTFQKLNFLHTSTKLIRDITFNADQQAVMTASMEPRAKIYDLRARQNAVAVFTPSDKALWACAMDRMSREHFVYLGAQHGGTYLYDVRYQSTVLNEFKTEADLSPVINVAGIASTPNFPNGGLLVCKLQSLWFFEYSEAGVMTTQTLLNNDGPFLSMNYDVARDSLLLSARSSSRFPQSRYLLGQLSKISGIPVFSIQVVFCGSKSTPVMTRSSQIAVPGNTLVAGYLQDVKLLTVYDARREEQTQSIQVQQLIYDTCPIYMPGATYLAALTETKCRIYELNARS